MSDIAAALFFTFNGRNIFTAHLFEHCLAAYFIDHRVLFHKATTHPLGVYFVFDKAIPTLPSAYDLEPYIDTQRKRINLEFLEVFDIRTTVVETMHELYSDEFSDALGKIEDILSLDASKLVEDFDLIFETKIGVLELSAKLPRVIVSDGYRPFKKTILIPKLNERVDVVELAIRLPQSIENASYLMSSNGQIKRKFEELSVRSGIVYGIHTNIITLQGGWQYMTYSVKTRAGWGRGVLAELIRIVENLELNEASFNKWKETMVKRTEKNWQDGKLTDLLITELVLWRRVLRPEDFENLDYLAVRALQKGIFDNVFILKDF